VKTRGRVCRYIRCYRGFISRTFSDSTYGGVMSASPDSNFDLARFRERASNRCVLAYVLWPNHAGRSTVVCRREVGVPANTFLRQSIARRTNERFSRVLSLSRARWGFPASVRSEHERKTNCFFSRTLASDEKPV